MSIICVEWMCVCGRLTLWLCAGVGGGGEASGDLARVVVRAVMAVVGDEEQGSCVEFQESISSPKVSVHFLRAAWKLSSQEIEDKKLFAVGHGASTTATVLTLSRSETMGAMGVVSHVYNIVSAEVGDTRWAVLRYSHG